MEHSTDSEEKLAEADSSVEDIEIVNLQSLSADPSPLSRRHTLSLHFTPPSSVEKASRKRLRDSKRKQLDSIRSPAVENDFTDHTDLSFTDSLKSPSCASESTTEAIFEPTSASNTTAAYHVLELITPKLNSQDPLEDRNRSILITHANMLMLENKLFPHREAETEGGPIDANRYNLLSMVRTSDSPVEIQSNEKTVVWMDGFDTKTFSKSHRIPELKPIFLQYRFRGPASKYKHLHELAAIYYRNHVAFKAVTDTFPTIPTWPQTPSPPSQEFWDACNELFPAAPGAAPASAYRITSYVSAWAALRLEIMASATIESHDKRRIVYPFKNEEHKVLGIFLQDVMVSNEIEEAIIKKEAYWGLKPTRSVDYADAQNFMHQVAQHARTKDHGSPIKATEEVFERDDSGQIIFRPASRTLVIELDSIDDDDHAKLIELQLLRSTDATAQARNDRASADAASKELLADYEKEIQRKQLLSQKRAAKKAKKRAKIPASLPESLHHVQEVVEADVSNTISEPDTHSMDTAEPPLDQDDALTAERSHIDSQVADLPTQVDEVVETAPLPKVDISDTTSATDQLDINVEKSNEVSVVDNSDHAPPPTKKKREFYGKRNQKNSNKLNLSNEGLQSQTSQFAEQSPLVINTVSLNSPTATSDSDAVGASSTSEQLATNMPEQELHTETLLDEHRPTQSIPDSPSTIFDAPLDHSNMVMGAGNNSSFVGEGFIVSTSPAENSSAYLDEHQEHNALNIDVAHGEDRIPSKPTTDTTVSSSRRSSRIPYPSEKNDIVAVQEVAWEPSEAVRVHQPYLVAVSSAAHRVPVAGSFSGSSQVRHNVSRDGSVLATSDHHSGTDPIILSSRLSGNVRGGAERNAAIVFGDTIIVEDVTPTPKNSTLVARNAGLSKNWNSLSQSNAAATTTTFQCTTCKHGFRPSSTDPLYLCPGCGPTEHAPRYCSVACLLVDALDHASGCARRPAYEHSSQPGLPTPYCVYEEQPLMASAANAESPEMLRQRTFALYCRYGPFPELAAAWCRKVPDYPYSRLLCELDEEKLTGIYHVFESGKFRSGLVANPTANVLFTVTLENGDPLKCILSSCLHSLFVRKEDHMPKPVTQLVFRAISHIITSPELYNRYGVQAEPATFILQEFQHQFFLETGFHSGMDCMRHRSFDLPFEATITTPYLTMAEVACPLLLRWALD